MKQFILNKEPDKGIVRLEGSDYRYLVRVRRLATGEFFPALLPDGEETLIQVLSIDHGVLTGKCTSGETSGSLLSKNPPAGTISFIPPIILFQAMPKGEKMDLIIRQAAEGGITEIVPFISEFSIGKINAEKQKFLRWERIIKEARQQSGSKTMTTIRPLLSINALFDYWKSLKETGKDTDCPDANDTDANDTDVKGVLGVLFHHEKLLNLADTGEVHRRGLENNCLHGYLDIIPKIVVLAIGPEGGFSDREAVLFMDNGFKPMTIGDTVLRTETAAVYCTAAIRILLLERNSWELK